MGAYRLYELIYEEKDQKVIIISGCSTVCTTLAEAASQWNLVTMCYGASSPALSNRERFPTLFRTHPSATVHNPTRTKLFKRFKWSQISVIQEAEEVFLTTLDDLEKETKKQDIEIVNRQIFKDNPEAVVKNLKLQDARVVVGLFYEKTARKVLCEIYKNNMFGPKYVWFFIGWFNDDWFMDQEYLTDEGIQCTQDQMIEAAQGHFTTEALMRNQNEKEKTYSGRTVKDFDSALIDMMAQEARYREMISKNKMPEGYLEAPLAYDAVWAVALALNSSVAYLESVNQTLDSYNYDNKAVADIIMENMQNVKFEGISGTVAFSSDTGDRMALTMIEQLVGTSYQIVGYYDQRTDNLTFVEDEEGDVDNVYTILYLLLDGWRLVLLDEGINNVLVPFRKAINLVAERESSAGQNNNQGRCQDCVHVTLYSYGDRQHHRHHPGNHPDHHQQQVRLSPDHPAFPPQLQQPHPDGQHSLPARHNPARIQHKIGMHK